MNDSEGDNIKHLVLELRKGNEKAFQVLYNRLQKRLYFFILQYTKSPSVSEEIIQEIFIKIWLKRSSIDQEKDFVSFVFTIARNMMYDYLRKAASSTSFLDNHTSAIVSSNNKTEDDLQLKEYQEILNNILGDLPEQKQKIYFLSREQGKSNNEIAEKLGLSSKTVKNNLWEIMKVIKSQIQPHIEYKLLLLVASVLFT